MRTPEALPGVHLWTDEDSTGWQVTPAEVGRAHQMIAAQQYRLCDLTAVDHLQLPASGERQAGRFEVVYQFRGADLPALWLHVRTDGRGADIASAVGLFPAAAWPEREIFDLFGIAFRHHPNLQRLFLPEDFVHWPLRRDYPPAGFGEREQAVVAGGGAIPEPSWAADANYWTDPLDAQGTSEQFLLEPHHPLTLAGLPLQVTLAGEQVEAVRVLPGCLHSGTEKLFEQLSYLQLLPLCERISEHAGFTTALAYVRSLERLLGVEVPPRGQAIRESCRQLTWISSHLAALAAQARMADAEAAMHAMISVRARVRDVCASLTGAATGFGYLRLGGVGGDLPAAAVNGVEELEEGLRLAAREYRVLLLESRAWCERAAGLGVLTATDAWRCGLGGVVLQAAQGMSGEDIDRAMALPGGAGLDATLLTAGDTRARTWIRWVQLQQSAREVVALLHALPEGGVCALEGVPRQPSDRGQLRDAQLIEHFEFWMEGHGLRPECGRSAYVPTAAPEGEVGFYLVSDGSGRPYRAHLRTPSLFACQVLPRLARGVHVDDLGLLLSSLHIDVAELDR